MNRALLGLLLFAAACGSDSALTATNPLGGVFVLQTYNGGALPAYFDPPLGACGAMVVTASITPHTATRVGFSQSLSSPCSSGNPVTTTVQEGTVTVSGNSVTVAFSPPDVTQAFTLSGTLSGNTLTLGYSENLGTRTASHSYVLARQ